MGQPDSPPKLLVVGVGGCMGSRPGQVDRGSCGAETRAWGFWVPGVGRAGGSNPLRPGEGTRGQREPACGPGSPTRAGLKASFLGSRMNFQKVQTSGSVATALRLELLEGGQPGTLQDQGSRGREAKRNRASCRGDVRARRSLLQRGGAFTGQDEGGSDGKESACSAGGPGLIPGSGRSPGEGHGYTLQDSCLENPVEGGAWRATVHGVTKSQTRLSY